MTAAKFTADAEYSPSEIKAIYLELLARGAKAGVTYTVRGKSIQFPGPAEARATIDWCNQQIAAESSGIAQNRARLVRR